MSPVPDPLPPVKTRKPRGAAKRNANHISLISDAAVMILKFETSDGRCALLSFDQISNIAMPEQLPVLDAWKNERRADQA